MITEQAGEFRAALPEGGVLLGLDLGTRTIGTAFCDAGWSFAGAGKTLPRGKFARDRAVLEALVAAPARKFMKFTVRPPRFTPFAGFFGDRWRDAPKRIAGRSSGICMRGT